MSLLIDALKQAEAAQRQTPPTEGPTAGAALQLEPVEPPAKPTPVAPAASTQSAAASPRTNPRTPSHEAARELFEVKRSAAPSRLPLILAAGGLALLAVGAAYIWWATQPRGGMQLGAGAPLTNASAKSAPVSVTTPITPSPQAQSVPLARPAPIAVTAPTQKTRPAAPTREAAPSKPLQPGTSETPVLRRSPALLPANDAAAPIQQAFAAYAAGDLASARQGLLGVLRTEPKNIDALNAMAMIALRSGRPEEAERYYRQALIVDPKDANTRAQLVLLYSEGDPATAESRLRQLLTEQPESATALFALGSIYARQSRWSEAQRAFFQSHTLDTTNADTLYNLAVSLDHLNQPKLAQQYYERAAATGRRGQVAFDPEAARKRANDLQDAAASKTASP